MAKILIIDDLATDRANLSRILLRLGHQVIEAQSANEGLNKALVEQPALVCMDVVMPDKSGFQATRELKKNPATAHIPVIMVSSKNRAPDELNAKQNGAVGYVFKPASPEAVAAALKKVLG